ncbi:MAG: inverse autotransporter beta domain-containing protein [Pseudomonadota bacterium]
MRKRKSPFFIFSLVVLLSLLLLTETANAAEAPSPRLSANGYASDFTVGQADLMLPIKGDGTHNLYLDPDVAYGSDNQGYADLGLGYRWIQNDAAILGGYVFGGYSRLDNNARVWVANPGIEAFGSRWDAHLNGYFPMGDRSTYLGEVFSFTFTGHSEFMNDVAHVFQQVGNGGDAQFAYQLFPGNSLKASVGTYFFSPKETGNLWGGAAGLEYWMDQHVKVFARYTYDNLNHSTGALGLGVEFGGMRSHRSDPDLAERLTDPVERYLAELGRGSGIPSRKRYQPVPAGMIPPVPVRDDIAYFSQTGGPNNGGIGLTLANCTEENPCGPTDLTNVSAITLDTLLPDTVMYFNGGSYAATDVLGGTNPVTLQAGQSVSSRTADYSQPATGAGRSTFNGAFILNSNNTLENIILLPTAATAMGNGVLANNASNVLVPGSQIGSFTNPFNTGVLMTGSSQLNITDSQINAKNLTGGIGTGILAKNNSIISANDIVINMDGADTNAVKSQDDSQVTITVGQINLTNGNGANNGLIATGDSTLNASNITLNMSGGVSAAVASQEDAQLSIIDSQINQTSLSDVTGLFVSDNSTMIASNITLTIGGSAVTAVLVAGTSKLSIVGSQIDATASSPADIAFGFRASGSSTTTASDTQVNLTTTGGNSAIALATENAASIQFDNGSLSATGGPSSDIKNTVAGGTITITSSTCNLNGSPLTCP